MEQKREMTHEIKYRMEAVKDESAKLYIYDEITADGSFNWNTWEYEESETSAKYIRDQLEAVADGSTIEVHFNSCGGEVGEGVTIYNLLKQKSQSCKVVGYVDGYAYSAAMVIAMACDEIHMGLGTSMLLHNPWGIVAGNAKALRQYANQLDALSESSLQLFSHRAKISKEEVAEMMDAETLLDPEKCKEYGFCDFIDTYDKPEAKEEATEAESESEKPKEEAKLPYINSRALEFMANARHNIKAEAETPTAEEPKVNSIGDTLIAALRMSCTNKAKKEG